MSAVHRLSAAEQEFLASYLPNTTSLEQKVKDGADRPFVTLTYASSLDSMISLSPGTRTTLSGPETKSMTHYLRMHHDAILVGVGTAIPDDPGLNSRYPGADLNRQPRPLILDPKLRWNVQGSKVKGLAEKGQGKAPWLLHSSVYHHETTQDELGVRRLCVGDGDAQNRLGWSSILAKLRQEGIRSVMIEGGANVISTLLQSPDLVDSVIITIAPTWLGQGGVVISPPAAAHDQDGQRVNAASLTATTWRQFGQDAVLCGRLHRRFEDAG